jgi:hypothetical protein
MKTWKQILFTFIAVVGLSLTMSAQKGGQKPPPKNPPPKIEPKPKDPPKNDKPKKPGMAFFVALPSESEYAD